MVQFPESDKYSLPLRLNLLQWPLFCFHQKMRLSKGNLHGVTNSKTIKCLFIRPIIHIIFISIVLSFACSIFNVHPSPLKYSLLSSWTQGQTEDISAVQSTWALLQTPIRPSFSPHTVRRPDRNPNTQIQQIRRRTPTNPNLQITQIPPLCTQGERVFLQIVG